MSLVQGILLSCLVLSALAEEEEFSKCPSAIPRNQYLTTFRNRCYEFAVYRETYWPDANAECQREGGSLVSVNDAETQVFLIKTLVALNFAKHGIWIGLNDQKTESSYEWASGDNVTFTDWASGEPNFAHGVEDCVLMKSTKAYAWEDHPCHLWPQHYSYICEYGRIPLVLGDHLSLPPAIKNRQTGSSITRGFSIPNMGTLHGAIFHVSVALILMEYC